jgi:hypothetical protein
MVEVSIASSTLSTAIDLIDRYVVSREPRRTSKPSSTSDLNEKTGNRSGAALLE